MADRSKHIIDFLSDLHDREIHIRTNGDKLNLRVPKGGLTPELRDAIAARKGEILEFFAAIGHPDASVYGLSHGQRAMWYSHLLDREGYAYNVGFAAWIRSDVDVDALRKALQWLSDRHTILRSSYGLYEGKPFQLTPDALDVHLEVGTLGTADDAALRAAMLDAYQAPYDLENGPIFRNYLFRNDAGSVIFLMELPHIAVDGLSLWMLLDQLRNAYASFAGGAFPETEAIQSDYRDFTKWQRDMLVGPRGGELTGYWKQQLQGAALILDLPTDRPRPAKQRFRGQSEWLKLDPEVSEALVDAAKAEGLTTNMFMMAVLQLLLHRWSGQHSFQVGTPMSGRGAAGLSDMMGYLVNPIAVRADFDGVNTIREHLHQTRDTMLAAMDQQDYPFPLLVEELGVQRDASRPPIYQVSFVFQQLQQVAELARHLVIEQPGATLDFGGLEIEPIALDQQEGLFDLLVAAINANDGLYLQFKYASDLFDAATAKRMLAAYAGLLRTAVENASLPLAEMPLLVETGPIAGEQAEFWPGVLQQMQSIAATSPDAMALREGERTLTYSELERSTDRLAAHLRESFEIGTDRLVAILLDNSIEAVIAMLGIMKAGGAYLPIDPAWPEARIQAVLADAAPAALLLHSRFLHKIEDFRGGMFAMDIQLDMLQDVPEAVFGAAAAEDLAYVIYTSGSTGTPKGVLVPHGGLANYVHWASGHYRNQEATDFPLYSSLAFDLTVTSIFVPLCTGGCIHVYNEGEGSALIQRIFEENRVSAIKLTPAHLRLALHGAARPSNLECMIVGGEAFSPELARAAAEQFPQLRIYNEYGPTEAVVGCIVYEYDRTSTYPAGLPIGTPIANSRAYVLDEYLQPVPQGVRGELYIGGAGLARGYHGRPELTAERFLTDAVGEPMYKTGDIVRLRNDGLFEFLGRRDHQLKVRGYRIEADEILHWMERFDGVQSAFVTALEDQAGDAFLCAWIVEADACNLRDLKAWLSKQLPAYMVPDHILRVEAFPLTHNGKVDRDQLPRPEGLEIDRDTAFRAPETETERLLAEIWTAVLERPDPGLDDNFFVLGGHSLKATQVAARVLKATGIDVSIAEIFDFPTIAELSAHLDTRSGAGYASIPVLAEAVTYPLSNAQARLWVLDQMEADRTAYNMSVAYKLSGQLDVAAFEAAFGQLIARHESLRTVYGTTDGQPVQRILPDMSLQLEQHDFSPSDDPEAEIRAFAIAQEAQPFDLGSGPMLRMHQLQFGKDRSALVLTVHHIILDAWSVEIMFSELMAAYKAQLQGNPVEFEPLGIQYKDFAGWQNAWLEGEGGAEDRAYWHDVLGGELPLLDFPLDHPRPPIKTYNGAQHRFTIPTPQLDALRTLTQQQGASLYMGMIALINAVLHRYTHNEDIIIGAPIAGRNHPDLQTQVGLFTNTLPIRTTVSGSDSFISLLDRVKAVTKAAYDHQQYPLDKLVEELDAQKDRSRSPIFDFIVVLQGAELDELELEGVELELFPLETRHSQIDIHLRLVETRAGLDGVFTYNTDLFEARTLEQLANHLGQGLVEVLQQPEGTVATIDLLTEKEKDQQIHEWNGTTHEWGDDLLVPGLFEQQVAARPDATALVMGSETLTYAELNTKVNQLAHHLRDEIGIQPDDLVGILAERSPATVIGILAVWKAGGAYFFIDPDYPSDRVQYTLQDASPKAVLLDSSFIFKVEGYAGAMFAIDIQLDMLNTSGENPVPIATARDLAYMIYTSGSTGKPKGVLVEHGSLANLARAQQINFKVRPESRFLQFVSLTFDVSVQDVAVAMSAGASLYLTPQEAHLSAPALADFLRNNAITHAPLPVSVLSVLPAEALPDLEGIFVGGEALAPELVARWATDKRRLLNVYGPSETTVSVIFEETVADGKKPPIGRPIQNVRAYILDARLQPVPVGVGGELYVGGIAPGRGYLNRPNLTAAAFIDNPFVEGERMYKTGDYARFLADGRIDFLGRKDKQVKIRGFRVELGEIETRLLRHSVIAEAVVIARPDAANVPYLTAYYTAETPLSGSDLRSKMSQELPAYMVPAYFIHMDALPLNASGKVDEKRLPLPETEDVATDAEIVAAATPTEKAMLTLWEEVLERKGFGVADNFFELGGHSLRATKLITRIFKIIGAEITLREVFESPTIAELSAIADGRKTVERQEIKESVANSAAVTIPKTTEQRYYPMSSAQRRLWVLDQLETEKIAYNMPAAIRLKGNVDPERLESALQQLIHRHEILRTQFVPVEGQEGVMQEILRELQVQLAVTDLRSEADPMGQAMTLHRADARTPFNLGKAPLMRAHLLRLDDADWMLLFNMHHVISDGWSMGVLLKDLSVFYNSSVSGKTTPPAALSIQHKDYSEWQNNILSENETNSDRSYWIRQLQAPLSRLNLPMDHKRPSTQSFDGALHRYRFSVESSQALKQLAHAAGGSLFMGLTTLLNVLLHRYSRQTDIVLGTPVAGRQQAELQSQIGHYLNMVVLRNTIDPEASLKDLLQAVIATTTEALAHQSYPFDRLVEEVQPDRDLGRSALFDVMVQMQNNDTATLDLDGIEAEILDPEVHASKFDLSFSFMENGDAIEGFIVYNTALFREATVARMAEHLLQLTESVISAPETAVRHLTYLSEKEQNWLLNEVNAAPMDMPEMSVLDLFNMHVQSKPDHPALVFGEQKLTYAQFNDRANVLAHTLVTDHQVRPDDLVAVLVDPSDLLLVAMFGVLKAGAAYLPIDPGFPPERIRYTLRDSRCVGLLSDPSLIAQYGDEVNGFRLSLNALKAPENGLSAPDVRPSSTDLAYCIYTSGTTGRPKGVAITHGNLFNYSSWVLSTMVNEYDLGDSVLGQGFAFDLCLTTLYGTLLSGNTLHVLDKDVELEARMRYMFAPENGATWLKLTPSHIAMLDSLDIGATKMKVVVSGGEPLKQFHLDTLHIIDPFIRVINHYGPTETTIGCAAGLVVDGKPIDIGSPALNTRIYVVDEAMELVPQGHRGEIVVAGAGVARGYLHQPELTAERFPENPFVEGERMYRTGDMGRWTADGRLQVLGRMDDQLKVRGFRVEPAEIEVALNEMPEIERAVVIGQEAGNNVELWAFLKRSDGAERPDHAAIQAHLAPRLPDYMHPAKLHWVATFPLNANGKIDKPALLEQIDPEAARHTTTVPAQTRLQQRMVAIWEDLLDHTPVGITDNFFALGGHSLKAIRLSAAMRRQLDLDFSLREIFAQPTIMGLSALAGEKEGGAYTAIPQVDAQADYRLSNAQRRLWVIDQLQDDQIAYNMPMAWHLEGNLNVKALEKAVNALFARHEILRTTFFAVDGAPVQRVQDDFRFELPVIDLVPQNGSALPVEILAEQEARTPFDLEKGPLLRVKLYRINEAHHLLLLNLHHIVSDGWSMGILRMELGLLYDAFVNEKSAPLAKLSLQYKDFAEWQQARLDGDAEIEASRNYWLEKLSGELPVLDLQTDWLRPTEVSFNGAVISGQLSPDQLAGLNALARQRGISLYMVLVSLVKVLLHRYTGQEDLIVGAPVAGRKHPDLADQIGFYVNSVALRDSIHPDDSFLQVLKKVSRTAQEAFDHEDYPFDRLVDELQLDRDLSRSPVFDVLVDLNNNMPRPLRLSDLKVESLRIESNISKFDLTLNFAETEKGLELHIEYNTDLYKSGRIERMIGHFGVLTDAVLQDARTGISRLPMLTMEEHGHLLHFGKCKQADYPLEKTIVDLFEGHAVARPDAPAVIHVDGQLTYGELNQRANGLAKTLIEVHGVGPGDRVGLAMTRSEWLIVGILGILKTGAGYVPVDPEYPADRIAMILEDSECKLLLQKGPENSLNGHAEAFAKVDILQATAPVEANPERRSAPDGLAYIIYTSGSTGRPKGVMISHKALANLVHNLREHYDLNPESRVLQFASPSFDMSVEEIFPALGNGCGLCLRTDEMLATTEDFLAQCDEWKISFLNLPPAYWSQLVRDMTANNIAWPSSMHRMSVGGDAMQMEDLKRFLRAWGDHPGLIHAYGPTEVTVNTSFGHISDYDFSDDSLHRIPIGWPLNNIDAYILDKHHQLVPEGIGGELYCGGVGIADGFYGRPEQTDEYFVPHPFDEGKRLYKSGDRLMYDRDLGLVFLSRTDQQLKIRGYRIEPGEIEARLADHPSISAAVVAGKMIDGQRDLVAYLIPMAGQEPDEAVLRQHVEGALPHYMVPTWFITVEDFPKTTHGKIDRKALPAPVPDAAQAEARMAEASNETEAILLDIWQQVLQRDELGIHHNFFHSGGDSIKAIQVIARLGTVDLELKVRDIFVAPTIAGLAQRVRKRAIEFPQEPVVGAVKLTPIQQQFFAHHAANPVPHNQSVVWRLKGDVGEKQLREALEAICLHHDALRLRFEHAEGEIRQYNAGPEQPAFELEVHDLRENADYEAEVTRIATDTQSGIDLANGPLLRSALFRTSEGHYLLLAIHHLAVDGVSWRILSEDFVTALQQLAAGEPIQFPRKTHSFQHWGDALAEYANGRLLKKEISWWKAIKAIPNAPLPGWKGQPQSLIASGTQHEVVFDATRTAQLLGEAHATYNTNVNDLLLTALGMALANWTGQAKNLIELEGHGREQIMETVDISRTVGWFTSQYPVQLDLSAASDLSWSIRQTKEMLRRIPNKGVGYGILKHMTNPESTVEIDFSQEPAVLFNYLGQFDSDFSTEAFELSTISPGQEKHADTLRENPLSVEGYVSEGQLHFQFRFGTDQFESEAIATLANHFQDALGQVIDHCLTQEGSAVTPSDLGDDSLSLEELDDIMSSIGG